MAICALNNVSFIPFFKIGLYNKIPYQYQETIDLNYLATEVITFHTSLLEWILECETISQFLIAFTLFLQNINFIFNLEKLHS